MKSNYLLIYNVNVEILDTRGHFMMSGNISENLNETSSMPKSTIFGRRYKIYSYFSRCYPTIRKLMHPKIGLHINESQYVLK